MSPLNYSSAHTPTNSSFEQDTIKVKEFLRKKGRIQAHASINEIYDMKLLNLLNETAHGLSGVRGRSLTKGTENFKQRMIARKLFFHTERSKIASI